MYRTYAPMVLRRCRFLLKDEAEALDIMQDVFIRILARVVLPRNLAKNDKANKVYITNQGMTLWQKKTNREQRNVAA